MDDSEGWSAYRIQVISELRRINESIEKLADSDTELRITVGKLQLVAAVIGGAAGVGGAIVGMLFISVMG